MKQLIIIAGQTGAGRTTALGALNDVGFQASDAVPPQLWEQMLEHCPEHCPGLALGFPTPRALGSRKEALAIVEGLRSVSGWDLDFVFLAANDEVLRRRFSESRRLHTTFPDHVLTSAIEDERLRSQPLREAADTVLDTSNLRLADFRSIVRDVAKGKPPETQMTVMSFSYRRGVPVDADMVFDVRFLANPHYDPLLRPKTGQDLEVAAYVEADREFGDFYERLVSLLDLVVQRQSEEGKAYFTIAFGCTGGKHRSVLMAEKIGAWIKQTHNAVKIRHRDKPRAEEDPKNGGKSA